MASTYIVICQSGECHGVYSDSQAAVDRMNAILTAKTDLLVLDYPGAVFVTKYSQDNNGAMIVRQTTCTRTDRGIDLVNTMEVSEFYIYMSQQSIQ
jgi:hypothetical protein